MRRILELMLFGVTTVALVATSKAPDCATETSKLMVRTTCGTPAEVTFSTEHNCLVNMKGFADSGLPFGTTTYVSSHEKDAGIMTGFRMLRGSGPDLCVATPSDGGLALDCPSIPCSGTITR